MKTEKVSQQIQSQANIYAFLQRMYEREIDSKMLSELPLKMKPLKNLVAGVADSERQNTLSEFLQFIDSVPSQDEHRLQTMLAADYASLFLSMNKVPAHPSESTYREGTLMQVSRDAVLRTYWSYGVSAKEEFTEPEDHIAIELGFLAFLCQQTVAALERSDVASARKFLAAHREFLTSHVMKWVPRLVQDILEYSRTPFYKGIATLTGEFLAIDLPLTEKIIRQLN